MEQKKRPIALTIAGSDSGGGAGIQADLKTFAALKVHGTSIITCVTAQSPKEVLDVQEIRPSTIRAQWQALEKELPPAAIKTGMLYSAPLMEAVVECLSSSEVPLVVDPVMVATSGALLLKSSGVKMLIQRLLPLAAIVTPNVPEAEILCGRKIRAPEDLRWASRQIYATFGCAVLLKGGHLKTAKESVDLFYDGTDELLLGSPRVRGVHTHGTGCTFSAAVTAELARGNLLKKAVIKAKEFITHAIANSYRTGKHQALGG